MMSQSASSSHATPPRAPLPFPTASSSSQFSTPSRSAPISTSSSSSSTGATYQPLTVASLLDAHANTPSPALAALEQAVSERNMLSSQNAQLWKLIEKQRSGYNSASKDNERLRKERDELRSKLQALGGMTVDVTGKKGRSLKSTSSSSALQGGASGSVNSSTSDSRIIPVKAHDHDQSESPICRKAQRLGPTILQ
jgi:RalA-binding protein 1